MKTLNKLPMALTILGLGAASAFAEIKINDNLSTAGFLDMSALGKAQKDSDATLGGNLDQYELDFMYHFGSISGRADINSLAGGPVVFEQGFVNYSDSAAGYGVTVGRFLSSSGFEAAEPTGLFQYSTSKTLVYGGYQNGLALNYGTPMYGLYGAVVTDLWNNTDTDFLTPGFEGQVSLMPAEGITVKAAYLYQMYDDTTTHDDQQLLNIWAQYAKGNYTFAAEYNMMMDWKTQDNSGNGWLAMANIKWTDKIATTFRYSGIVFDGGDPDTEVTFSPSYTVSPNWLVLAEVKQELDLEITDYAVESTFSF